ncbi:MAG: hypothetical protein M3O30_09830 [Planctomycetota bacterium]|nr:hypothetical protein [Planctomycetota bacterium]
MNLRCGEAGLSRFLVAALATMLVAGGCAGVPKPNLATIHAGWLGPTTRSLAHPAYDSDIEAVVDPPLGWRADTVKSTSNHTHKAWLSPTGLTAYGIIHFQMPLPVGQNLALGGFLRQMKDTEGQANLLERADDPNLPGIRFVAEGGRYKIRANFIVDGWQGWAVYAGTLRNQQILPDELDTAVRAREHTRVGKPEQTGK